MWWISFCYCLNISKTIFLKISLPISLTLHYFWRISTMPKKIIRRVVQDKKIQLQTYQSLLKLLKELDCNTSTLLKEIKGTLDLLNLAIGNASLSWNENACTKENVRPENWYNILFRTNIPSSICHFFYNLQQEMLCTVTIARKDLLHLSFFLKISIFSEAYI